MVHSSDLRTELGKVKGLGSAKHGVSHWMWQRLTAIAMVPLSIWFICAVVGSLLSPDVVQVATWFSSPLHAIPLVLLLLALFIHAKLGVQVVIEDYVHTPFMKYALLLLNKLVCYVFIVISIMAVLKLHFLNIGAGV